MTPFQERINQILATDFCKKAENATTKELYAAISKSAMSELRTTWTKERPERIACYLSAEFLMGRLVFSNLMNLGLLEQAEEYCTQHGLSLRSLEEIEDDALGNGGLGRLAACFLDSGASLDLPLYGFGIRYRYGLFKQYLENGFQREVPDDWLRFGDPWSVRREEEKVAIRFKDQSVWAVPYDMPIIGYGGKTINTLRLWQAEATEGIDFDLFNKQDYSRSFLASNMAEAISDVLYPNDDTDEGKKLRLKQQYFFVAASLHSLVSWYRKRWGHDFSHFAGAYAVQLNDTHPTVAIPELLRILMEEELMEFSDAFEVVKRVFAYTNHTVMAEALEKWNISLFNDVIPQVYPYVIMINDALRRELTTRGIAKEDLPSYEIVSGGMIHMARMAVYASHSTNGVAKIHTEILKADTLKEWYALYPERFNNKTNGITQRRWLALCNPGLSKFITDRIGDGWITNLDELKKLEAWQEDKASLQELVDIKRHNKEELCRYIQEHEGVKLNPNFVFDVQIKRLHEYKRQLLNAFSILDIYFGLKEGRIQDFNPTVFLFGAKSAPGYYRAKAIIKFINEVAARVNSDPETNHLLKVLFVQNYNVSYAEKLIPAADVSEQISTAGTEASGTSNMKFMLNGAVTLGTYDGANIEIVQEAGEENNYIFGARVEDLEKIRDHYDPKKIMAENDRIRRVVNTLIDGTFDDDHTGMFQELYNALIEGASWHKPDHYFLLLDLPSYVEAKLHVNRDLKDELAAARRALLNIANAGKFSSDRTIRQYADEIWHL
ncbi:MAG TPA: glycogen/starch/alpha-glucan phosphorylase [Firmicutes bacterium]|nr:glycogen/starch/alpha-glucan phosphorylase [Bacillota bacterium]